MFADREEAGQRLASELAPYWDCRGALVLGLARGGVLCAAPVSRALRLPLDVFIARKLTVPGRCDLAFGCVAETGAIRLDRALMRDWGVTPRVEVDTVHLERQELEWRRLLYRGGRSLPPLEGRTLILVDDAAMTGATFLGAVEALRARKPKRLVAALPVAPAAVVAAIQSAVDDLLVLKAPEFMDGAEAYYKEFEVAGHSRIIAGLSAGHAPRKAGILLE